VGSNTSMGYKVLGYAVWQGAKWYMRRRAPDGPPKLALVGIAGAALAVGGLIVAQRRSAH
jgi:hypothetical protein